MARPTILVLDDCGDFLELMTILLDRICGRTAIAATSLDQVVALFDETLRCEMAFLDINLGPEKPNGIDVYRWLRSRGFKAPIYFLTGHARCNPLVAEAERLGDARVLSKPVSPDVLIKVIRGNGHGDPS